MNNQASRIRGIAKLLENLANELHTLNTLENLDDGFCRDAMVISIDSSLTLYNSCIESNNLQRIVQPLELVSQGSNGFILTTMTGAK